VIEPERRRDASALAADPVGGAVAESGIGATIGPTGGRATERPTGAHATAGFAGFDATRVPSPCFVVDRAAIAANLAVLAHVRRESGAKVLSALKAFSMWRLAPLVAEHLDGTCSSGLHEAQLGHQHYPGEVHVFSAAFSAADLAQVLEIADHVVFNSFGQWRRFRASCLEARKQRGELAFGLRINPEHSEGTTPIYDPCAPGSRLGIPAATFAREAATPLPDGTDALDGISGLHLHTLCEQGLPPLQRTLAAVEARFGEWLPRMAWLNLGGGHHISAPGYDVPGLIELLRDTAERHGVQMYLEPGEAVAINSGALVCEVLDVGEPLDDGAVGDGVSYRQAILDTSATCHMPDTLEMPYRAELIGAFDPAHRAGEGHVYRLGGMTCLAGDVIGDYAFEAPLRIGQRLVFDDMAHYTMVKTTTFNGIGLPGIALWDSRSDSLEVVKTFGYEDFRDRLS